MSTAVQQDKESAVTTEYFDVLIVGAGISGIGSAYHLLNRTERSFVMLEAMDHFGAPGRRTATRDPLRQRSLYLWLPVQALDECADRDGRGDSEVPR